MVYRPTARVLTVLELLQSHGRMSGTEIARRLEVNIRTVRDYIEILQDLGIPVEAERGRYGGYHLRPGYKLPPLIFTEDESIALSLSLLLARENGLGAKTPAIEGALAKIERVLPEATRARILAIEQTVNFEQKTTQTAPSSTTVAILSSAIQNGNQVHMRYETYQAEITERLFDPYGIAYHEGLWYTIGFCHLRQGQRLFRLDRIQEVKITSTSFHPPLNFSAADAIQHALASVPRTWSIDIWLDTSLDNIQQKTRFSRAQFEEAQNGVFLRGDVSDLPWVASLLTGLGIPFVIYNPPELRACIIEYTTRIAGYANQIAKPIRDQH